MIIKKIKLSNFQVIKDLEADFEGNVYFVTGENELGKSTLLNAIVALLTGNRDNVLKKGESKGFAKMIVGDDGEEYEVDLRFTEANPRGTLSIKSKESGMKTSNVSILNKIFGYTNFDAVEFSRWSETAEGRRKQIEVIKSLLPENVRTRIAEIDTAVARLKAERVGVSRDLRTYQSISDEAGKGLTSHDLENYSKPKDISGLMLEQQENIRLIEKAKAVRLMLAQRTQQLEEIPERLKQAEKIRDEEITKVIKCETEAKKEYDRIVAEAQKMLEAAKRKSKEDAKAASDKYDESIKRIGEEKADLEKKKINAEIWLAEYKGKDPEKLDTAEQLRKAEEHNRMVAKVSDYMAKRKQADYKMEEVEKMNSEIAELSSEREKLVSSAKLPISGLSFTEDGLVLNGVPFIAGKVSDSQIMEVAVKLVIASNPTVKVFCLARGESLGRKRLRTIIDIAKKNGFQGFIEEVKRGQQDLIIEEYTENE